MGQCRICKKRSERIADFLGVCLSCIRERPGEALSRAKQAHGDCRREFGLPEAVPDAADGLLCRLCVNRCRIPEGTTGYCGVRRNERGRLVGAGSRRGNLSWYHDPLPTNCVGDRVCPGGTGAGHPHFAYRPGPEHGYSNLAVFFHACTFNCLYCQNWHFRKAAERTKLRTAQEMAEAVDGSTSCICFFGGDPAAQFPFSLKAAGLALKKAGGRILRICWETNGSMAPALLDRAMAVAMDSGGLIKFDLKAWDDTLHRVLTGVSNARTLENFQRAASLFSKRPEPPPVIASTLMVPGYVESEEVGALAKWIAGIHPDIPYRLLAFHPQFRFSDLPLPTRKSAAECLEAAMAEGLRQVGIGNDHLLL